MARALQLLALVLLATAANADLYFYPCSSGVINCDTAFPPNWYGDFGLSGKTAINDIPQEIALGFGRFTPEASTSWGEVAGFVSSSTGLGLGGPGLGYNGLVWCAVGCTDDQTLLYGINNNGYSLWVVGGQFELLGPDVYINGQQVGPPASDTSPLPAPSLIPGNLGALGNIVSELATYGYSVEDGTFIQMLPQGPQGLVGGFPAPFGLNDSNQILTTLEFVDSSGTEQFVQGVLSPFAVPEPSAIALLSTIICIIALGLASQKLRLKRTTGPKQLRAARDELRCSGTNAASR